MSAEIHRITPAGPISQPESTVIKFFEDLLEQAKRGEIKGAGVFYVQGNDTVSTNWIGGCAEANFMAAGAAMLNHRVIRSVLE